MSDRPQLRTNFGFPIQTRSGESTACWAGDKITVLSRSGGRALCRVSYGYGKSFEAWMDKSLLKFKKP